MGSILAFPAVLVFLPVTASAGSPPRAYTIVEVEVTDPAGFAEFDQQLRAGITAVGGRYHVLPVGVVAVREGERPKGIALIVWNSVEQAEAFSCSAAIANPGTFRERSARLIRPSAGTDALAAAFAPGAWNPAAAHRTGSLRE